MGTGPVAGLTRISSTNLLGYILGSSGLDLYRYKLGREVTALNDPAAYLTAKRDAVDRLINQTTITNDINNETFTVGGRLGRLLWLVTQQMWLLMLLWLYLLSENWVPTKF